MVTWPQSPSGGYGRNRYFFRANLPKNGLVLDRFWAFGYYLRHLCCIDALHEPVYPAPASPATEKAPSFDEAGLHLGGVDDCGGRYRSVGGRGLAPIP